MISANVSKMFASIEPCYVSASRYELGDYAGAITWRNALAIADNADRWLLSDMSTAIEDMRRWAKETGAWSDEELDDRDLLALFAQNVAHELREAGADDIPLEDTVNQALQEGGGYYYVSEGQLLVGWG